MNRKTRKEHVEAAYRANISGSDELFVKTTIDELVKLTGLPAIAKILQDEGIASRTLLRKMERRGIIKRLVTILGQGRQIGYYTEDEVPTSVREWRDRQHDDKQGTASGHGD